MNDADQLTFEAYRDSLADRARRTGEAAALRGVDAHDWLAAAAEAIADLASTGESFGADDVRRIAGAPPSSAAMGAAFGMAHREGRIQAVGYAISNRPARHRGVMRLWVGAA